MLKKVILATAAMVLLAAVCIFNCFASQISAESAIVIEAGTGTVLFEKTPDKRMLIASTTKIMTTLVALENSAIDSVVTIPKECENIEGSSLYLKAGEQLTLRELLYGLMLESGNDAAVAVAYHVSGSVEEFVKLMNNRAKALGCENTSFANPNGLDADGHYSSAEDLAKIMAEAMKNELFVQIVSTKTISFNGRSFSNHNKLLWSCDGIIGGKTGYTKSAGRTLVSCAERDGMRLICVTLNAPSDWNDHIALYDEAFSQWELFNVCTVGKDACRIPVISGVSDTAGAAPAENTNLVIKRGSEPQLVYDVPEFVYADVTEGTEAGTVRAVLDGETLCTAKLYYTESIKRDGDEKLTRWEKVKRALSGITGRGGLGLGN